MNKKELNILMKKIQDGDETAFTTLYNTTCKGVFSFAYSIVGNTYDAEDIMQDTYIKIRRFAQTYTIGGNLSAWILQITKNTAYDFLKKNNRIIHIDNVDIFQDTEESTPNKELFVYQLINKHLSLEDRQIVILHILHGYKNREIAELLHIPIGTVLWRYNKAMKTLKEKIKEVSDEK